MCELVTARPWCTLAAQMSDLELAQQFAAADLFVLATRTRMGRRACGEGFGLVLIEAQVAGTPVIVPAHGGSSDAYAEGVTGLAPVDETPEALATVLRQVLDDRAKLAAMGKSAAEWARKAFAPECYAPPRPEACYEQTPRTVRLPLARCQPAGRAVRIGDYKLGG